MAEAEEDVAKRYEELVRYVAEPLLGTDDFEVKVKPRGGQIRIDLLTPANVRGRVIGRGGRIARSFRNLLDAAAIPTHLRPTLDIVD